jgi:hypothetical protein
MSGNEFPLTTGHAWSDCCEEGVTDVEGLQTEEAFRCSSRVISDRKPIDHDAIRKSEWCMSSEENEGTVACATVPQGSYD